MAVLTPNPCDALTGVLGSLRHCEGVPNRSGLRRTGYFIQKKDVVTWPGLPAIAGGQMNKAAVLVGPFTLAEGKKWHAIDVTDASEITYKTDGEYPEITYLNEAELIYASDNEESAGFAALAANDDLLFALPQMNGKWRILGHQDFRTECKPEGGTGKKVGGGMKTTIKVSARDYAPAPFFTGTLDTDDGTIQCGPSPEVP